jgi:hypothetical protein
MLCHDLPFPREKQAITIPRSTTGSRKRKATAKAREQGTPRKEVKTSKKAPSSNPLGAIPHVFHLAIPHSFPFRSIPFQFHHATRA